MERELDQFRFTSETKERNSKESLASLNEKVHHLKKEISSLENRLERQLKESQRKIDEERKISMDAIQKLRMMENVEENLKITIENLSKKVDFFKEKSLQSYSSKPSTTEKKSKGAMCRQMSKNSSTKTLLKGTSRNRSPEIRSKLARIALNLKHVKENFRKEKALLSQQLGFFKKWLKNALQILTLKSAEETGKVDFLNRELKRAKKDLEYYERLINDSGMGNTPRVAKESSKGDPNDYYKETKMTFMPHSLKNHSFSNRDKDGSLTYSINSPKLRNHMKRETSKYEFDRHSKGFNQSSERDSQKLHRRLEELRMKEMKLREKKFGYREERGRAGEAQNENCYMSRDREYERERASGWGYEQREKDRPHNESYSFKAESLMEREPFDGLRRASREEITKVGYASGSRYGSRQEESNEKFRYFR